MTLPLRTATRGPSSRSRPYTEDLTRPETARRCLDAADTRVLAAAEDRRIAGEFAAASLTDLLIDRLHLDPGEARRRVRRCDELGPRRALTGEILPAILPATSHALAQAEISAAHADVIIRCTREVDLLPGAEPGDSEIAENLLLEASRREPPRQVERLATALLARLDQDGTEPADQRAARTRSFTLRRHPDGTSQWTVRADAELTALLEVLFDTLAAPRAATGSAAQPPGQTATALTDVATTADAAATGTSARSSAAGSAAGQAPASASDPPAALSAASAPSATDLTDDRTATQRRHDAMRDALHRLLRSGDLPVSGGTPTTVIAHVRLDQLTQAGPLDLDQVTWNGAPEVLDTVRTQLTAQLHHTRTTTTNTTNTSDTSAGQASGARDDLDSGSDRGGGGPSHAGHAACDGYAVTGHDGLLSGRQLGINFCEAELDILVTNPEGAVLALGRSTRLATRAQRLALAGRDRGCCFPSCTRPAPWTEAHHVTPWLAGGRTDLSNLCLLCPFHHRRFDSLGWAVRMNHGTPEWTPPPWIDPQRRPIRNSAHHLLDDDFPAAERRRARRRICPT